MLDSCGRTINYLRISITDRCNLRCRFCMPESGVENIPHGEILRYEEILEITKAAADLGINRFRISGGEPLLRRGIEGFLKELASQKGASRVSLTTNGLLLASKAKELAKAGLNAVNVSLDSLNEIRLQRLCGGGTPTQIIEGIDAAIEASLKVKVNAVLLRPVLAELPQFINFSEGRKIPIRFIEFMPLDKETAERTGEEVIPVPELIKALQELGELVSEPGPEGCGPSRYYRLKNRKATIGIISALSSPFCDTCNRIRLTADGRLKPCLASAVEIDVKKALREGANKEEIKSLLRQTIEAKPKAHQLAEGEVPQRNMSKIGG